MRVNRNYQNHTEWPVTSQPWADAPRGNDLGISQVFVNVNMSCGLKGLTRIADEHGIDLDLFPPGKFVVFVNRSQTRLKLLGPGGIVVYLANGSRRLTMDSLNAIPQAFKASGSWRSSSVLAAELGNMLGVSEEPTSRRRAA